MKVVSLFSGIGGFELGFEAAGHETILTCENAAPAKAVLKHWFGDRKGIPNHDDVTTLADLPADTDILCAGFPCQDLSQAGKTAGIDGERSGLIHSVFRLLRRRRVPWVVIENVSFMLRLQQGRALDTIVTELEALGYRWAYRVVNSLGWLPHRRERVFLVASLDGDPADVLFGDDTKPQIPPTDLDRYAHGFYWTEGIRGLGWAPDHVPTLKNGSTVGIPSPPAILLPEGGVVTPDIRDAERLQGFRPDHTKPAEAIGRASLRWSLVGNAVTVPVAKWLGSRLGEPGTYDPARSPLIDLEPGRWPSAARYDRHHRTGIRIGTFPVWRGRPALSAFLAYPTKPLSLRATTGFLARAETSSLALMTPEFKARVRAHLHSLLVASAAGGLAAAE